MKVLNSNGVMTFHTGVSISSRIGYDKVADLMKEGDIILLLEGGSDINPALYGQENRYSSCFAARDEHEVRLYNMAREYNVPMLGICRGHQLMAALAGGTLYQDIATEVGERHGYKHNITYTAAAFDVGFRALMESNPTGSPYVVNSLHHQAVATVPSVARVLAHAPDTTPEALYYPWGCSVQWHPEMLGHEEFLQYMRITFLEGGVYGNHA